MGLLLRNQSPDPEEIGKIIKETVIAKYRISAQASAHSKRNLGANLETAERQRGAGTQHRENTISTVIIRTSWIARIRPFGTVRPF